MRKNLMSLILVFVALSLMTSACGPQAAVPAPTATNQLATLAPTATIAPTDTLAPTATTAPSETPLPTATATPAATVTSLPTFTPKPEPAGYTYFEDFSDNLTGYWPQEVNEDSTYGYMDGAYAIVINTESFIQEVVPNNYLGSGDVVIEVDAWKDAGSDAGDFGVVCGFLDYENYFAMGISTDGSIYVYQRLNDEENELLFEESKFTPTDRYHLIADCQNGHFTLDVNGTIAIDFTDTALTSDGGVGIYGGAFDKGPFIYYFDNFKATQPGQVGEHPTDINAEVVFSDDFSTKDGGWKTFNGDNSASDYSAETFTISIKSPMFAQWNIPVSIKDVGDAVIEVDARLASGPDEGDFGIVCGYIDNDNFHVLAIANDGYAEIVRWVDGDDDIFASQNNAFTPADEYHLVASCVDGSLSLTVNGLEVLAADSEFLKNTGGVGLYGGTFDEGDAVYAFDNFVVYQP